MANLTAIEPSIPLLYLGRIDRTAFTTSLIVLLALCWLTAAVRFYVRIGIQRAISIDDGFLIFGLCCLTASVGLLFSFLDKAYTEESFLMGQTTLALQAGFADISFDYHELVTIVLILAWLAISSVKLSFLFLFRRLIDRLGYILFYWWIVLVYVLAVSGYGAAVNVLSCPYFYGMDALRCTTDSGLRTALNYTISQIALDVAGDLMILVIPIYLIWKIKLGFKQKFWLSVSLCLTVVMIIFTIVRVSGVLTPSGKLDTLWDDFWNIISAEVGLIMTSATAFRVLYSSKTSTEGHKRASILDKSWISTFIRSSERMIIRAVQPRSRNSHGSAKLYDLTGDLDLSEHRKDLPRVELCTLPRAHMTGLRTAVGNAGRTHVSTSTESIMQNHWEEELEDPNKFKV